MPRPPVKKTEKLEFARRKGELRAEYYMHKKKPLEESLREHIGKLIDRIDPIELAAVAGTTFLVHAAIMASEELVKLVASTRGDLTQIITGFLISPQAEIMQWIAGSFAGTTQDAIKKFGLDQDWEIWLISLSIAYIVVHNFGSILSVASKSITSMTSLVTLFLPAAAA